MSSGNSCIDLGPLGPVRGHTPVPLDLRTSVLKKEMKEQTVSTFRPL